MEKGAAVEVRPLFVAARVGDLCPAISRPHIAENRPERGEVLRTAFAIIENIIGYSPFLSPVVPFYPLFSPKTKSPGFLRGFCLCVQFVRLTFFK